MMLDEFERKIARYTDLALEVGVNLQPGQRLQIKSPLPAAPFTRLLAKRAYQRGTPYVDVIWRDEQLKLIRHKHAPRGTFEEYPAYVGEGWNRHVREGGASLYISGDDPDLLSDQDPEDIATEEKTKMEHRK